jgi:sugar/nucleoside kinase (ribokinase family)
LAKKIEMKKILGIGNALVDVMTIIDDDKILESFGLPKGSMQLVDRIQSDKIKNGTSDSKKSLSSGGSAANTIHGLAMIGVPTGFIGSVGRDETGDFFENDMISAGVKTYLTRRTSTTGTSVAIVSPDSERTMATHLGAAVELDAADLNPDDFKDYNILYLEGYLILNKPLVEKACKIAIEYGMKVALDLASYNVVEANHSALKEIIENYVDIVFANEEEAKSFTGSAPEEAITRLSEVCEIAVVKVGKEGSLIKRGDEVIKIGTIDVKSIDTTGAGDLYASGFLYGYAHGLPLDKCGMFGSVLAGNVIETIGAKMDAKRWEKITKHIGEFFFEE